MEQMIKKCRLFLCLLAWLPLMAGTMSGPDKIEALKKMYPDVQDAVWTQKGEYEIAVFTVDGFEEKVWFGPQAVWVMTQIDWGNIDRVSPAIFNAFALSEYADWTVNHVFAIRVPQCPEVVVVQVGQPNTQEAYQLLYATDGTLLGTRDASNGDDTLWPDFFNC